MRHRGNDMDIKKIENGREYRDLRLDVGNEDFRVEGFATTYNQPYHLYSYRDDKGYLIEVTEQVDRDAFQNTDMSDVIMQYNHEGRVFARMSNDTLKLNRDNENGLYVEAYLGGTEIGRQLYEEIKGGYTQKMSFGFTVGSDRLEKTQSTQDGEIWLRTITDINKVFDVSAVSLPRNDYTSISRRNYADGVIADVETERSIREERENRKKALEERIKKLLERSEEK